jgi:hypothetical protein
MDRASKVFKAYDTDNNGKISRGEGHMTFRMSDRNCKCARLKLFNPFLHEHFVKNGCFHWKSSCYYKFKLLWNYEKDFNTVQSRHKCSLDHSICNDILNFLLPWQRRDICKLPKITILRWVFHQKLISKCCNVSMDWNRIKGFSVLVTRYFR